MSGGAKKERKYIKRKNMFRNTPTHVLGCKEEKKNLKYN
jgi:hypothetical protein